MLIIPAIVALCATGSAGAGLAAWAGMLSGNI